MARMTKTQKKNALEAIRKKAWNLVGEGNMSTTDFEAIRRIINKCLKGL